MKKEFLPVGSVVLLKGGTKRVMITGFCSIDKENSDKVYDYTGCLYPEGIINSSELSLFDNDQIDKVYFRGFVDKEEEDFKRNLDFAIADYYNDTNDNDTSEETPVFMDNIESFDFTFEWSPEQTFDMEM